MPDPEILITQLKRSNRRWKALALAACAALIFAALAYFAAAHQQRMRAEAALRDMNEMLARANANAQAPGQPR